MYNLLALVLTQASCRGMVDCKNTHLPICITACGKFNSLGQKIRSYIGGPKSEGPSALAWGHPQSSYGLPIVFFLILKVLVSYNFDCHNFAR